MNPWSLLQTGIMYVKNYEHTIWTLDATLLNDFVARPKNIS